MNACAIDSISLHSSILTSIPHKTVNTDLSLKSGIALKAALIALILSLDADIRLPL